MKTDAFLGKLMGRAGKAGFEDAEVYMVSSDSARIGVHEGEVAESALRETTGISFRAMLGGKLGYASTEAVDEESIDMLIERAKDNARTVQDTDRQFIFAPEGGYGEVQGAYDGEAAAAMTPARLVKDALALEEAALATDGRILRVPFATAGHASGEVRILNTRGLDVRHRDNIAYYQVETVAKDGENMVSGFFMWAGNDVKDMDPQSVARKAAENATGYIGAGSVDSGKYPVVLYHTALASLLATFSGVFSAENAHKGLSLLKGKEGESIACPLVTLVDDPLMARGFASRPFDDEGVPASRKEVIAAGTLTTLLHNLKSASRQGVKTTGNASKAGYAAPVGISPFNFYLRPGDASPEALYRQMGRGVVIHDLAGLHSGANAVSGDFSLLAKGFFVENGEVSRPVNQITVAGNFFDVLKNVVALGDDLWFDMPGGAGACGGPSVLVESLSIAGK